jgi:hypothetical protein
MLAEVSSRKDLFQSVLYGDCFDNWELVRDLGEFLIRIEPAEIMGHVILTRAYRHLSVRERAVEELGRCRDLMKGRELHAWETQLFLPLLDVEERTLSLTNSGDPRT